MAANARERSRLLPYYGSARKCQRRRGGSLTPSKIPYVEINKLDQTRRSSRGSESLGAICHAEYRQTASQRTAPKEAAPKEAVLQRVGAKKNRSVECGPAVERRHSPCVALSGAERTGPLGALGTLLPAPAGERRTAGIETTGLRCEKCSMGCEERSMSCSSATTRTRYRSRSTERPARGSDIARAAAPTSSGLTGRPPAMYANVWRGPLAARRSCGQTVSGPNASARPRLQAGVSTGFPRRRAARAPPPPRSTSSDRELALACTRCGIRRNEAQEIHARSARSVELYDTASALGAALRRPGAMPSQASNSVLQRWLDAGGAMRSDEPRRWRRDRENFTFRRGLARPNCATLVSEDREPWASLRLFFGARYSDQRVVRPRLSPVSSQSP